MNYHELKFDPVHVPRIAAGEKTVTVRYDPDRELYRDVDPDGTIFLLQTPSGYPIGMAPAEWRARMTASSVVGVEWDGHRTYDTVDELLDEMRGYYPEAPLRKTSAFTVIGFDFVTDYLTDDATNVIKTIDVVMDVAEDPMRSSVTCRTVADATDLSTKQAGQALRVLEDMGAVEKVGKTRNNTYSILLSSAESGVEAVE